MADTTTKVLEVVVDNNKALSAISQYNRLIDEQKAKQKELAEEYKQGNSQDDYYKAMAKSREEIKAYSRSMQELSKEVQNNIKDSQEQDGSLRALRAQLSNLTKEYDALSEAERQSDSGKARRAEINRITDALKEAEEETQRFYRNVGNYPDVKPLETQLGEIKKQLAQLKFEGKENSDEFRELAEQAANMKDALADVEQQINATASDTKNLDTAVVGLSTVMSGLTLMGNIFADGSEEGEKLQKVIQKIQVVMATLTVLQTIQKNTQKQSLIYLAAEKVQLAAVNALKKVQARLTAQQTAATGAQTVAQRILNAVMKANPVFLLISALAALAAGAFAVAKAFSRSSAEMKAQQEAIKATEKSIESYGKALDVTLSVMDKIGSSDASKAWTKLQGLAVLTQQTKALAEMVAEQESGIFGDNEKVKEAHEKNTEAVKEFREALAGVKAEALGAAGLYDLEGLSEYDKKLKENNEDIEAWGHLLHELQRRGEITEEQMNKAMEHRRAQNKKALNDIQKTQAEADKKKREDHEKAIAAAAKRELDLLREATDAQIATIKDENERALAQENERHDRAVQQLRERLTKEKDLTVKEKEALNRLIEVEEQKHQETLTQLDWKAKEQRLKDEADLLALRLETIEEGGQQELDLRLQQLQTLRDIELTNTELTEEEKQLIREKYAKEEEELREEHSRTVHEKEMEEMRLFWENQIAEAALNNQNTLELELEQRKAELDALHQMEGESNEEFRSRQLEAQKAYMDAEKALNDYEVEITQAKMDAIGGIMSSLNGLMDAFGEENKAMAKASKVLALAEIAINTGKAIAAGIAQSQSVPFPGNIAAMGTTVATVLANISSAISTVKSAKFASGGYVSGPGTGTSDSVPARLSNGESVINARSTSMFGPLLSSLNQAGGGIAFNPAAGGQRDGYEFLASAVAAGMKTVKLRVGVDEVTRVQDRVATINEVSTIG